MDTSKLKRFAQYARRHLMEQVSAKLKFVLAADSQARRENPRAVEELDLQIRATSNERVIEKVAYIWFNRFCAIRFMDANRYTRIGILSPAEGQVQPEILAEAKMGHIDEELMPDAARQKVFNLLNGSIPSHDPQQEAYHLLVVASCNYYNRSLPFIFEKIADFTELLIPDDLLSGNSILAYTREAMTPDVCRDVEVIGWLYQFYISEKKDEVFGGLKKNKKISPENIPAATQLFTPHWIVRYLVENSLGRLWMLNHPNSRLIDRMDFYIKPETLEINILRIGKPEEIKLCDPACGSGHMLTYSYDVLYAIYEEEGYDANDIPRLILENNLFGVEIDERAGELAAFALTMKAAKGDPRGDTSNYRRFFRKPVQPNICILQNIHFEDGELKSYMDAVGRDLFTVNLRNMLHQFSECDNFGSLISPEYADATRILKIVELKNLTSDLFLRNTHERVLLSLKQADFLSSKYHVVIANPPYMGSKGMNDRLKSFGLTNYPDSKSDLFAMFIERNLALTVDSGMVAMITMQSWMFLSTYERLRQNILNTKTIVTFAHLGPRAFDSIGGEIVQTSAFVLENKCQPNYKGANIRLVDGKSESEKSSMLLEAVRNHGCGWFFRASTEDFNKIPGRPIAYSISEPMRNLFTRLPAISDSITVTGGMTTADNDRFIRLWYEISGDKSERNCKSRESADKSGMKWFPYNKGGTFRKWFGNREYHVNWLKDGEEIISTGRAFPRSKEYYFQESLTYSATSSSSFGIRYSDFGFLFDAKGSSCFAPHDMLICSLGFLASKISSYLLQSINPTIEFQTGNLSILPFQYVGTATSVVENLIAVTRKDWDAYETSWDFTLLQLLHPDYRQTTLKATYATLRAHWLEMTSDVQWLEKENNRLFIEAYGLQNELNSDVPLNEITLTCNPHYRYGGDKCESELEGMLLSDTIKEFISYAVGCMFGRYSLDKPGLILADQGETIENYFAKVRVPTFEPDDDNVIPILDEGWFVDDITERFHKFLKITFGEKHYEQNLTFLEESIGKDIRKYFLKDFFVDHLKRYKKRPIYWLFSSPKGSFNALIYIHRYRQDTVSLVLNYLREFRTKLSARKEHMEQIGINTSASSKEKILALKDLEKICQVIGELDDYERETIYPLATKQIAITLDDGVKVNYLKFGAALKKIPGLDSSEE